MINGDDADPNAAQFKKGAHKVLDGKVKHRLRAVRPVEGHRRRAEDVARPSPRSAPRTIAGVYSANDGMAGGIATALKGAGISSIPLTGQDAELAGIQRIVAGTQSITVYKAYQAGGRGRRRDRRRPARRARASTPSPTPRSTSGSGDKVHPAAADPGRR